MGKPKIFQMFDDMSTTIKGTNITAQTKAGMGKINIVNGFTKEGTGEKSLDNIHTIKCLADDVNLFDSANNPLKSGLWDAGVGTIKTNSQGWYVVIPITGGQAYTVSKKYTKAEESLITFCLTTTAQEPSNNVAIVDSWRTQANSKEMIINTSQSAKFLFIGLAAAPALTDDQKRKAVEELKIQTGSIATPYSEFGYGTCEEKTEGKELLNSSLIEQASRNGVTCTYENGIITLNGKVTADNTVFIIPVMLFGKNRIKVEHASGSILNATNMTVFQVYDKSWKKGTTAQLKNEDSISYNAVEALYEQISIRLDANVQLDNYKIKLSIIESDRNIVETKPLTEGSHIDFKNKKAIRQYEKMTFTGADTWSMLVEPAYGNRRYFFSNDARVVSISKRNSFPIANMALTPTSLQDLNDKTKDYVNIASNGLLVVWTEKFTTLEQFKAFLNNTNLEVIVERSTTIEEDVDCSDKIQQFYGETTFYNRDGAEIEVSVTNNTAVAEIYENINNVETNVQRINSDIAVEDYTSKIVLESGFSIISNRCKLIKKQNRVILNCHLAINTEKAANTLFKIATIPHSIKPFRNIGGGCCVDNGMNTQLQGSFIVDGDGNILVSANSSSARRFFISACWDL